MLPDKRGLSRWPRDIVAILTILAALLVYYQYTTLFKFAVLSGGIAYYSLGSFAQIVKQKVPLGYVDAVFAGLIFAAFTSIVGLELWKKRLSAFLNCVFASEKATMSVLVLTCLLAVRFYFARGGLAWAADANFHIGYAWVASKAFSDGEIPIWTNYFGSGSPYVQFYGFLFFYIVGLVDLLFRDIEVSLKLVMGVSHVFSGVGVYLFVRTIFSTDAGRGSSQILARKAGFIAGLAYVMTVWHTQQVLIMGRFPLSLFYAILPYPFYYFERLRGCSSKLHHAIGGSLSLGTLAFIHPGYAFWSTALLVLYVCIRLVTEKGRKAFRALFWHSLLLLLGGLAFGAYLTLPMWIEKEYTGLRFGINLSGLPDVTWSQLLTWANFHFRLFQLENWNWYGGYLGLSIIGLSMAGLASPFLLHSRRSPNKNGTDRLTSRRTSKSPAQPGTTVPITARMPMHTPPAAACLILSLILVFGYRWPILQSLSVVQAFNAGRYLLFVVFFLAVMAGAGTVTLIRLQSRHGKGRDVFTLLLLILIIDLGPTTFLQSYTSESGLEQTLLIDTESSDNLKGEAAEFQDRELPNYRIFYPTDRAYRPLVISYLSVKTEMTTFLGQYNEFSLAALAFSHPLEELLNLAIREAENLETPEHRTLGLLRDGLYLLNTKYCIALHSNRRAILTWTIPDVSPVVVSSKIAGWDLPVRKQADVQAQSALLRLAKAIGVNQAESTCDRILLTGYQGQEDLGTSPTLEVLDHRVWNQRVEMHIRTSNSCFARLSYAYYPYLRVTVNGKKVVHYETAGRFIALRLSGGENVIVIEPILSPLRLGLLIFNLALLALCLVYFVWRLHNSRPLKNMYLSQYQSSEE